MEEHGRADEDATVLSIKVDKRPISQSAVIGFALVVATQAFVAGGLYYKFTTLATEAASKADFALLTSKVELQDVARTARSAALDRNIDEMQIQLRPLATIELRLDQNDKRDDNQDARIDKVLEILSAKMDTMTQSLADVKADVRVVAQDVKNIAARSQPTTFKP